MRRFMSMLAGVVVGASVASAAPIRVALMDFQDQTGMKSDADLGGGVAPSALAAKGVFLLSEQMVGKEGFTLVDRRDFMDQMEKLQPKDMGEKTPTKPSFIQAAQALNTDVVLRGSLLSFSTGKRVVDQGGYKTEFSTASLRVGIEALDSVDGSVVAMANGVADGNFRQTAANYTVMSEEDVIALMQKAIAQAIPNLENALETRLSKLESRPKVKLSVKTSADPALIEIDGILVGTSPVQNFDLYKGDHVLTVGKPGYRDITKRILFEKNTEIEVPLMRTELSADEMKEVLEKARLDVISVNGGVLQPGFIIKTVE
jgi:hypothetical protein